MSATSASQSTESSSAFLNRPRRRLEKVTCRAAALSILFISRLSRAIAAARGSTETDLLPLPAAPPRLILPYRPGNGSPPPRRRSRQVTARLRLGWERGRAWVEERGEGDEAEGEVR